jgi:integrase/recombinase XerC
VASIATVQPLHVAAWIERQTLECSAPTVKQQLAALRHLFDWLVTGQVVPVNPAGSVRGPAHSVKHGKTLVLAPDEARRLLDSIDTTSHAGLRDRALIGLMAYSFARVGAATAMKVEDVFVQNRRLCVRLREKGGKAHALPCHHNLEEYLTAYLDGAGLRDDPKGPLFRTVGRGTRQLTRTPLPQANAHAMIRRRRHRCKDRQPQLPRDRHHRLSQERRHPGERRRDGEPRLDPHHPALRPTARPGDARRGRAGGDLRGALQVAVFAC